MAPMKNLAIKGLDVVQTDSSVPMEMVVSQNVGFAMEKQSVEMDLMKWIVNNKNVRRTTSNVTMVFAYQVSICQIQSITNDTFCLWVKSLQIDKLTTLAPYLTRNLEVRSSIRLQRWKWWKVLYLSNNKHYYYTQSDNYTSSNWESELRQLFLAFNSNIETNQWWCFSTSSSN